MTAPHDIREVTAWSELGKSIGSIFTGIPTVDTDSLFTLPDTVSETLSKLTQSVEVISLPSSAVTL